MMHVNSFIVSIKNENGEVLRESRGQEVFIPFDTHYSLLLKNNNNRKAVAEIYIDGTKVLGEHKIILDAYDSVNLERFCIDGDLSRGNKFKFVKSSNPGVQDPSSGENGIIKVKFWLEKRNPIVKHRVVYDPSAKLSKSFSDTSRGFSHQTKSVSPASFSFCDTLCEHVEYDSDEVGATVEGASSNQSFRYGSTGTLEDNYTEITLKIKPSIQPVTVKETKVKYCDICGSKNRYQARFCSNCGTNMTF